MNFIAPPSEVLKSSSKHIQKGFLLEKKIRGIFIKKGFRSIDPRRVSTKIQVDGLFYKKGEGWIIVEVKSKPSGEFDLAKRVSKKQAFRIYGFLKILTEQTSDPVSAHLAVVSQDGHIEMYENFLCDLMET